MSRRFASHWLKDSVAREMRRQAKCSRFYNGLATPQNLHLIASCTGDHLVTGTRLIFTRDTGHHSGGWWKNPDYERCWHLSISFREPLSGTPLPKDPKLTDEWLEAFYGTDRSYVWAEPPYSPEGKINDTWHYRIFCDPAWQPIIPRGEVYSTEFTERGWLSFSDLQSEHAKALAKLEPLPGEQ